MTIDANKNEVFPKARWIWSPASRRNHYALFACSAPLPSDTWRIQMRIAASYHYELYANGRFMRRGPVHGDPAWCNYDEFPIDTAELADADNLHLAVVVYHAADTPILSQIPAPPGLILQARGKGLEIDTDASWKCLDLEMWRDDTPARGWALTYMEDYDATREPPNWDERIFPPSQTTDWPQAVEIDESPWANYTRRLTPFLKRRLIEPSAFRPWRAPHEAPEDLEALSQTVDEEHLEPLGDFHPATPRALHDAAAQGANAYTFDLGRERIGFYYLEIEAPEGVAVDISGSELLRQGRPWVFRKGTRYTARYRTRAGRQTFRSFSWNGFRYLHLVVRGDASDVRILHAGCLERRAPLWPIVDFETDDDALAAVFALCRYTLEAGAQEHLIDCPTREQTQYWGDAVFIALSLWIGFGEPSYLQWYLESFLHVPFRPDGQIRATYPGTHKSALLDYSLIPLLGQSFHRMLAGEWYKPERTVEKALKILEWYDARLNDRGLVEFPYEEYKKNGLVNFIDHPGIGWHSFPHPGIDRQGVSAPLNLFLFGFLNVLGDMADSLEHPAVSDLADRIGELGEALLESFYDGRVFRDARRGDELSPSASWQTNALAVYFGLLQGDAARRALGDRLEAYDTACRCTPYFHFFLLPALRYAGMELEARDLIVRDYNLMLERDATTTWEAFQGDERDSLCHPWSTAPFLHLVTQAGRQDD